MRTLVILSATGNQRTMRGRFEPREGDGATLQPREEAWPMVVAHLAMPRNVATLQSDGQARLGSWLGYGRGHEHSAPTPSEPRAHASSPLRQKRSGPQKE
jgi:hypothetical protein